MIHIGNNYPTITEHFRHNDEYIKYIQYYIGFNHSDLYHNHI